MHITLEQWYTRTEERNKDIFGYDNEHYIELIDPFMAFVKNGFIEKTPGEYIQIKNNVYKYCDGLIDIMRKRNERLIAKLKEKGWLDYSLLTPFKKIIAHFKKRDFYGRYGVYDSSKWDNEFELGKEKIKRDIQELFLEIDEHRNGKELKDCNIKNIIERFKIMIYYNISGLENPDPSQSLFDDIISI
jgi:hypothetical protein